MSKLAGMEMFVKVVECGSFTKAAEMSDVSSTMVAKHIRTIEKRLGARLLHRTTRRQHLTEVGRLYYERCKHALTEVELAEASASELQASPRGLLRLVAPVNFGNQNLVPALIDYLLLHPEVNIDLTLDNHVPDLINEGYELGIQIGEVDAGELVARPLRPYCRILAAAPSYLAKHGQPEHPEQLNMYSCLGLSYWYCNEPWHLIGPDDAVFELTAKGRFSVSAKSTAHLTAFDQY